MQRISDLYKNFHHWLFPNICLVCEEKSLASICDSCLQQIDIIPHHCLRCFRPLPSEETICGACLNKPPILDAVIAAYKYDKISREIALSAKFGARRASLSWMAKAMFEQLPKVWNDATLCAMPMSRQRFMQRGFNQAAFLSNEIAYLSHMACDNNLMMKYHRVPQSSLKTHCARRNNIKNAFSTRGKIPHRIVLVDDVTTSGATLNEAASVLKKAGAQWVGAIIFAAVIKS